ncbi:Hsp20/alpha crystallin family protein [TM7 phylum sp. oral taxon 348]|jgi:small heat shock protein|nr:Hsp20/alpha crystallin family protein [Candidatus Saccharibacteria bacterium]MBF1027933.1 Hsp20/alpha crystallin family protein [Candidatus Nanosynbacter sp.]TWP19242.1 Hsp20/alpha crystallin family protein [TM7 phylum sp. oral taxon 348]UJD06596.1 MAG: Hsp20/alpha crystallin family protein [Candidatus Nanosynbacter sp. HMT-348_TM7c-JB]TWP19369.1 Hsp20/alpha crystallin family protein [TM7 phylum sp. oral taxon 348]
MARKQNDDLLMEDDLTAAFLDDEIDAVPAAAPLMEDESIMAEEPTEDDVPGQLAVDVYETDDELVIKARTAGVNKNDLDVSISEGILTISGTLTSGDEVAVKNWHMQECYWGEFSRSLHLPVPVKEDEAKAALKDGILSISFPKLQQEQATKIPIM